MKTIKILILPLIICVFFQCSFGKKTGIENILGLHSLLQNQDKKEDTDVYSVDFSGINGDLSSILAYKSVPNISSGSSSLVYLDLSEEAKSKGWKGIPSSKKVKIKEKHKVQLSLGGVVVLGEQEIKENVTLTVVSVMGNKDKVKNFKYLALSLSDKKTEKLTITPSDLEVLKGKSVDFSKSYQEFTKDAIVEIVLRGKTKATEEQVNNFKTEVVQEKSGEIEGNNDIKVKIEEIAQGATTPKIYQSNSNLIYFKNKFLSLSQLRVYSSSDARNWTQETTTNYPTGDDSSVVLFKNKLWIVAPYRSDGGRLTIRNEVFNSNDGLSWTQVRSNGAAGGFSIRKGQATVVFKNKLWILGGRLGVGAAADVWSSADGVTWKKETDNPGWNPRWELRAVVFKDKLWIVGGRTYTNAKPGGFLSSAVWSSADGINWEKVGDLPTGLEGHEVVSFKDKLWTIGGVNDAGTKRGEILVSYNGKNWAKVGTLNVSGPISTEFGHRNTEKGFYFVWNSVVVEDSIYFVNFGKAWKISVK